MLNSMLFFSVFLYIYKTHLHIFKCSNKILSVKTKYLLIINGDWKIDLQRMETVANLNNY